MGRKIWENFEEYILIASFCFVVPLLFLQIVMRYVFSNSISWSEELARYIFLWQIWLGASYAVRKQKHIRIDVIKSKLSTKNTLILEMVVTIIWIAFCGFLAWKGGELTAKILRLKQYSPALHLPMGIPYLSVPVGAGLMVIHLFEYLAVLIKQCAIGRSEEGA